jgi:hypothetical protein
VLAESGVTPVLVLLLPVLPDNPPIIVLPGELDGLMFPFQILITVCTTEMSLPVVGSVSIEEIINTAASPSIRITTVVISYAPLPNRLLAQSPTKTPAPRVKTPRIQLSMVPILMFSSTGTPEKSREKSTTKQVAKYQPGYKTENM